MAHSLTIDAEGMGREAAGTTTEMTKSAQERRRDRRKTPLPNALYWGMSAVRTHRQALKARAGSDPTEAARAETTNEAAMPGMQDAPVLLPEPGKIDAVSEDGEESPLIQSDETVVANMHEGQAFGEMALVESRGKRHATARSPSLHLPLGCGMRHLNRCRVLRCISSMVGIMQQVTCDTATEFILIDKATYIATVGAMQQRSIDAKTEFVRSLDLFRSCDDQQLLSLVLGLSTKTVSPRHIGLVSV